MDITKTLHDAITEAARLGEPTFAGSRMNELLVRQGVRKIAPPRDKRNFLCGDQVEPLADFFPDFSKKALDVFNSCIMLLLEQGGRNPGPGAAYTLEYTT